MKTGFTTISLDDLVDGFTGRDGMQGYDPEKPIKLYELNRDFVWGKHLREGLITSILTGFPIPPITTCNGFIVDGGNRTTTLWQFKNNMFTVLLNGVEQSYEAVSNNRELSKLWDKCQVPVVQITEATKGDISQVYENLNKGKPLSLGQLLENRKHIPVVDATLCILNRSNTVQFPHRDLINRIWAKDIAKTDTRSEIAFAFQLLVGSMYGPLYFHTSFPRHLETVLETDKSQHYEFVKLGTILKIIDGADPDNVVPRKTKTARFKKFAGAMVNDLWDESLSLNDMKKKWEEMFRSAYRMDSKTLSTLLDVGTARGKNDTNLQALSKKVQEFLDGKLVVKPNESKSDAQSVSTADESDEEY